MSDYIQPANLFLSTVTFRLISQWYIIPTFKKMTKEAALQPLLL